MTYKPGNSILRKEYFRLKTQEFLLKGYPPSKILEVINLERKDMGEQPYARQTIYKLIDELKSEHGKWYLDMMKDQTAFIILHRQKLLSLDLYKKMLHDKIALAGGISSIKPDVLNRLVQTLITITTTQAKLEKELPYLTGMTKEKSPEELKQIEAAIIQALPGDLREEYEKLVEQRSASFYASMTTGAGSQQTTIQKGMVRDDIFSGNQDPMADASMEEYAISIEQIPIPDDLLKIQKEVEHKSLSAHEEKQEPQNEQPQQS